MQVNVLVLVVVGDAKLQVGVALGNGSFNNVSTPGRVVSTDEGSGGSVAEAWSVLPRAARLRGGVIKPC